MIDRKHNAARHSRPILMLALALGLSTGHAGAATPPAEAAPDVAKDPAAAWRWFLAHGDVNRIGTVFGLREKVGYTGDGVDAAACREHVADVRDALQAGPVSIVAHRIAMLCAEATGDEAGAERELQAVAALSKHALSSASEASLSAPVRVVGWQDINALLASAGLEARYEYYQRARPQREFPIVVAAWDPERKVERHLRFDWVDTLSQLLRDPEERYPLQRARYVDGILQQDAEYNDVAAVDVLAVRAAAMEPAPTRVPKLRTGAEAGGQNSAFNWILLCSGNAAPPSCADGLVEALLPQAEKQFARPMTLLAYAYYNGLGVPRDEAAAMQLLDAADARWSHAGATSMFVDLWQIAHPKAPLPSAFAERIAHAIAIGNEDARYVQVIDARRRDPKSPLSAADIAYFSSPARNGQGHGFELLSGDPANGSPEARRAWLQAAADAGSGDAQAQIGSDLLNGKDVARDAKSARAWLERAAVGGSGWAARRLYYLAAAEGDLHAGENWLLEPASRGDIDSMMDLARLWMSGSAGISGTPAKAVEVLRMMPDLPEARRTLAVALMKGQGVAKDPAQARALLLADAKQGDHDAEALLGLGLLQGTLGPVDESEGRKWTRRAIDGGIASVASDYGYWLFYTKDTPASRKEAIELWRAKLPDEEAYGVANNLAWALCTTEYADVRDGRAGLDVAATIGNADDMAQKDTVAACHAAAGDFVKAKALQQEVVDAYALYLRNREAARSAATAAAESETTVKAERDQMQEFRDRLQLYVDGKPYVEVHSKQ